MPLTPLGQRLARVAESPETAWTLLVENVPLWPSPPNALSGSAGVEDDRYAPSQGLGPLVDALCRRERARGVPLEAESVLVTNGGFDALALVSRHLHATGTRRVHCIGGALRSAAALFRNCGFDVIVQDWDLLTRDPEHSGVALSPQDVLYVNVPHNPTGRCLTRAETARLLSGPGQFGHAVLLDLVYDSFVVGDDAVAAPLAAVRSWDSVYAVNSFSKNYGAPGLRVGWAMGAAAEVEQLVERFEHERIAVGTTAQLRAARLCAEDTAPLRDRVMQGQLRIRDWAECSGFAWSGNLNGTQAWIDIGVPDAEELADLLMHEEHLVLTTGANYHPCCPEHIRIPAGIPIERLDAALEAIAKGLTRLASVSR